MDLKPTCLRECGMSAIAASSKASRRFFSIRSGLTTGLLVLTAWVSLTQPSAAIPAFARKFGMPCSACHEAWPKLNNFGQTFKDNGYQMGNDRDSPIYKDPSYWPVSFRITPHWHRENTNRAAVDGVPNGEGNLTVHGFDLSGLDILTAGTLSKNISFLLTPSANSAATFHFESAWVRFDNLLKSSWLNVKVGKFELDNILSEKRILALSNNGGLYQIYHYLPAGGLSAASPADQTPFGPGAFGIGDNQIGFEVMGHSKNSYTRYSVSVLSNSDGQVGLPTSRAYDVFLTGSQAFELGSLGLQRVGGFAYIGQYPTYGLTSGGTAIPGAGLGNKMHYLVGGYGLWYLKKLDFTTMFTHAGESAYLATATPGNAALPAGAHDPSWNGALVETHYTVNPQFILVNRFETIRMSQQPLDGIKKDFGNLNALTFGYRWYPFINSRDGFAIHNEYARVSSKGTSPAGNDSVSSSVFLGFDFIF